MLIIEQFIQHLIRKYGKHSLSTDSGKPYPQECRFLNLEHHQYIKDRTDALMTIFHLEKVAVSYNT